MSVLFDALSRAARDHRQNQKAERIPLMTMHAGASTRLQGPFLIALGMAVPLALLAGLYLYQYLTTIPAPTPPDRVATSTPAPPPATATAPAPTNGIALSGSALEEPTAAMVSAALAHMDKEKTPTEVPSSGAVHVSPVVAANDRAGTMRAILAQAHDALDSGDTDEALSAFEAALVRDPANPDALEGKAYALQTLGTPEAERSLRAMVTTRPLFAPGWAALASLLTRQGDKRGALEAWSEAVRLKPRDSNALLSLAVLYDRMGRDAEALATYRRVPAPLPYAVRQRVTWLEDHLVQDDTAPEGR